MLYLLRTVPTALVLDAATLFDDLLQNCLRDMVGGSLSPDVFRKLQLPLNATTPCFGIGLTSAKYTASSAFLASLGLVRSLHAFMLQATTPAGETGEKHALNSYNDWRARSEPGRDYLMGSYFVLELPITTRAFETCAGRNAAATTHWRRAHKSLRSSLRVLGAKGWLKAQPSPGLETHIQHRDFRLWFKFYCRIALFNGNETCPRKGCHAVLDQYGDHLLHCPNGMHHSSTPRIWRHNSQVRLLGSALRKAAR